MVGPEYPGEGAMVKIIAGFTAIQKIQLFTSGIGAQQKKKKMAEKITKKNVKTLLLQSQLKPDDKNLKEGVD